MERSESRSTLEMPRLLLAVTIVFFLFRVVSVFLEPLRLASFTEPQDLVPWKVPAEGIKLATLRNKPVLFWFIADGAPVNKKMIQTCFSDENLAAAVNDVVVPIKVVDKQKEHGRKSEEIAKLEKHFMQDVTLPQLVVVSPDQLEGTITAKSFTHVSGDCEKGSIYKLLELASLEHDVYFDRGDIAWSAFGTPHEPGKLELYVFLRRGNAHCTDLCNELFKQPDAVGYINKYFTPYLLVDTGTAYTPPELKKVEDEMKIDFYPSIIMLEPISRRSAFLFGYTGDKPTLEFIKRSREELLRKEPVRSK